MGEYFDAYGMVKANMHEDGIGPNNILFYTEYCFLKLLNGEELDSRSKITWIISQHKSLYGSGTYKQSPTAPDSDPASHDNMTAMVCLAYRLKFKQFLKSFRVTYHSWHPRDILFYNWCKGGLRRLLIYPFWWLMIPIQFQSCWKRWKYRKNNKMFSTDGKLLTWLRCQALMGESVVMRISWHLCSWAITRHGIFGVENWQDVFNFYFKEKDHPNRSFKYYF